MSNAKKSPNADCKPRSLPISTTPRASGDGATTTPFVSSTPCSTSNSSATLTTFGESTSCPSASDTAILAERVAVADYAARIASIAERISLALEQSAVLDLLREGTDALGAECAVFVSFVRGDKDLSACRFMLACDPSWCRRYLELGCITHDPWLAYAAHHSEPVVASSLAITEPDQRRAIELATQNGFASAVLVPAYSGPGQSRISLLCLGSATPGYFESAGYGRFRISARTLASELHGWWLARIRRDLVIKSRITPSDLELLRHERQGHSSKRIAAELHVSKSSINSRFQRMNAKLGVPNRRLAARLAAECGLILN